MDFLDSLLLHVDKTERKRVKKAILRHRTALLVLSAWAVCLQLFVLTFVAEYSGVYKATGIEIGLLVAGVALSALAGILLKPKPTRSPLTRNNTGGSYAERGAIIPYVQGTARVGPVIGWLSKVKGQTQTVNEGFLGFGVEKVTITKQSAWHILCIGPADQLVAILQGGARIFPIKSTDSRLSRGSTASGSTINLGKNGKFKIYWGEHDQPVDPLLASITSTAPGVGAASRWPNVCYILWLDKVLDAGKAKNSIWPSLEYIVQVRPFWSKNFGGSLPAPIAGVAEWNPGDGSGGASGATRGDGCDSAHLLYNIIHGTYPHGIGIPTDCVEPNGYVSVVAATGIAAENTPQNAVIQEADEALRTIGDIMQDIGMVLPQVGDKLVPVMVREVDEDDIPVLTNAVILPPLPEKEFLFGERPADQLSFQFKERGYTFRDNTVDIGSDGDSTTRPRLRQIECNTMIDQTVVLRMVDRRQLEEFSSIRTFRINAGFGARVLSPGQVFFHEDFGTLRITSNERRTDSAGCVLECVEDVFTKPPTGFVIAAAEPNDTALSALRDIKYDFIEAPPPLALVNGDKQLSVIVLRQRADTSQVEAQINVAVEDETFEPAGVAPGKAMYGTLDQTMLNGGLPILEEEDEAFAINVPDSFDADVFEDLTGEDNRWRAGALLIIIEKEICFFRNIEALSDTVFLIHGLIRGRLGTTTALHTSGCGVFLIPRNDLDVIAHPLIAKDTTLQMEVLAISGQDLLTSSDAEPIAEKAITGLSKTPYPPVDFCADDNPIVPTIPYVFYRLNSYATGGDVRLRWSNRTREINGTGAGTQPAGVALEFPPVMDGELNILLEDNDVPGVVKRWIKIKDKIAKSYAYDNTNEVLIEPPDETVSDEVFFEYENADLVSDFGSEVNLKARYFQADGIYRTAEQEVVINLRPV